MVERKTYVIHNFTLIFDNITQHSAVAYIWSFQYHNAWTYASVKFLVYQFICVFFILIFFDQYIVFYTNTTLVIWHVIIVTRKVRVVVVNILAFDNNWCLLLLRLPRKFEEHRNLLVSRLDIQGRDRGAGRWGWN